MSKNLKAKSPFYIPNLNTQNKKLKEKENLAHINLRMSMKKVNDIIVEKLRSKKR